MTKFWAREDEEWSDVVLKWSEDWSSVLSSLRSWPNLSKDSCQAVKDEGITESRPSSWEQLDLDEDLN